MMMIIRRVMCVLAVVLCCACGYTMTAAAAVDNDSPSGRGVSRGAVEVSCGAGGALRVRPAAESEWLTCGAGSRVSACGKYADLCRKRTARAARTETRTAIIANEENIKPYAGEGNAGSHWEWDGFPFLSEDDIKEKANWDKCNKSETREVPGVNCSIWKEFRKETSSQPIAIDSQEPHTQQLQREESAKEKAGESASGTEIRGGDTTAGGVPLKDPVSEQHPPSKTQESTVAIQGVQDSSDNTMENTTVSDSNPVPQSPSSASTTAISSSEGTNTTTPASPENTTTEAPTTTQPSTKNTTTEVSTTTPSTVPNAEMSNNIASTLQKKANVDSSVSSVWVRVPLLIVVVLVSATLY
ncbi:uncharacterized protein TM35_000571060 [Trypanosoma theileri]|uniref:Mucin-like glycoprotein n=1 Tax=Trypanosoma theileri TaxID=67003 RepID=A0A1X0NGY4_9TRYP|nr:uncharacterized protein TM35_000571060 [Trypanosoma theileri]ORC83778.1 hypothetical protein TM35_000571060 [Trypanosoma theileri]